MASITISLPDSMLDFINTQTAGAGDAAAGEYVRELVRQAQAKAHAARLSTLLREGQASTPIPLDEAFRQTLAAKVAAILDRSEIRP
jgi:antitoxin ParD1/3/4